MTVQQPQPGWARATGHVRLSSVAVADSASSATDRLAIAERIARYGWSYDERDRDGLADCFTSDGVWEGSMMGVDTIGPFEGRAAVAEFLTAFWDVQTDQRRHVFTNVVVDEIAADTASAHAYLLLTAAGAGVMQPVTTGPYRFDLRREADGVWRMARLSAGFDAPF